MTPFPSMATWLLAIIVVAFVHAVITIMRRPASKDLQQVRSVEIAILLMAVSAFVMASIVTDATLVGILFLASVVLFLLFTVFGLIYAAFARRIRRGSERPVMRLTGSPAAGTSRGGARGARRPRPASDRGR